MKTRMFAVCALSVVLAAGCGRKQSSQGTGAPKAAADAASAAEVSNAPAAANAKPAVSGNPINAPMSYLGAVAQGQDVAIKQIDLAYVTQAIQQFNAGEGRFPKNIAELKEENYLGKLPQLPPGYELKYNAADGSVWVGRKGP